MLSQRAQDLHFSSILVDCHSDSFGRVVDQGDDFGRNTGKGHMDLPRMREGNLTAEFFACFVHPDLIPERRVVQRVLVMADAVKQLCAEHPGEIGLARTATDVRRLAEQGRRAAILCIEGGHAIEDSLAVLRQFHELGVRYMTLTWNNSNNWADGCLDTPRHHGLSPFGREVVGEMNHLGMLVDVSHVSEEAFWDAQRTSTKPVIASHSSAWELCDHPRNLKDDQLKAVAEKGGVVCVNFSSTFISQERWNAQRALDERREWEERYLEVEHMTDPDRLALAKEDLRRRYRDTARAELPVPSLGELVDHIQHIARVAGVAHVGLGSDFDGVGSLPVGMGDCTRLPFLTEELLDRGFTEGDVRKILGENVLRLMGDVVGE